eukprot:5833578-Karenia_brevis.AAC.1
MGPRGSASVSLLFKNQSKIGLGGGLGEVWGASWPQEPTRPQKLVRPPLVSPTSSVPRWRPKPIQKMS